MRELSTPVAVRAYTERPDVEPVARKEIRHGLEASDLTLVFDCETTVDEVQQLRFGFYQIRAGDGLESEGIFYEEAALSCEELQTLMAFANEEHLNIMPVNEFRNDVFLYYGYRLHAMIVGFNLPFDLSRIAIDHGSARGHMRGGFSFLLTHEIEEPRVRVKHLSPKAALIEFAQPGEQDASRGMRKRGISSVKYRGHFVDVKTLAAALLSGRFKLGSLASYLELFTQKHETDEHGSVSSEYLDYARADVQVTWEAYRNLLGRYQEHGLDQPLDRILSEASIGKAYLQAMGVQPYLASSIEASKSILGRIFCAYYGGRAEVRLRREICEVQYCDFKSMYPTVNSLMGLWDFVIADGVKWQTSTELTQQFLDEIAMPNLQDPATWRKLHTLVELEPESDVFPVRAKYNEETYTIGLNALTSDRPLWFTLADCIVSKLMTGKTPQIRRALTFTPGPSQCGLRGVWVMGSEDYHINPEIDDFFTRLIDLRDEAKSNRDPVEKTLKIIANASSYGIFIEVNRDDGPKAESLDVYGPTGERFSAHTKNVEQPGRYFHPLVGVLNTGAARLMLGLAEKQAEDLGLDWAFCDTDSLAMVRPDTMSRAEFHQAVNHVIDWFAPLNPYRKPGSILQLESVNRAINGRELEPLYCYAISAKRYALFNLDDEGDPILRKASAHGLGHLIDPYNESEQLVALPSPQVPLSDIGVKRWHHDLWIKIVQAVLDGHPNQVALDWHPALNRAAVSRYNASSPALLRWLRHWNAERPYQKQIRPFGFLMSFMARTGLMKPYTEVRISKIKPGRPKKTADPKPIAPFNNDLARAIDTAFDRETGYSIGAHRLKTYTEALAQYHLSPEPKFDNARHWDQGQTQRRHVIASNVTLIGKEANQIGDAGQEDPIYPALQEFRAVTE